jgi:hypothetical protein
MRLRPRRRLLSQPYLYRDGRARTGGPIRAAVTCTSGCDVVRSIDCCTFVRVPTAPRDRSEFLTCQSMRHVDAYSQPFQGRDFEAALFLQVL